MGLDFDLGYSYNLQCAKKDIKEKQQDVTDAKKYQLFLLPLILSYSNPGQTNEMKKGGGTQLLTLRNLELHLL